MFARSVIAAFVIIVIILVAFFVRRGEKKGNAFCGGPYNIQLYDNPYLYPWYEGREVTDWDGDKRCVSYCAKSPCDVWCR
jgi:hypothetical protein